MRLVYAVPGLMDAAEMERRGGLLRKWAAPGTEVDIVGCDEGPASIESAYEEYLSIKAAAELVVELEKQDYDGIMLGCAGDPGLDAMRELATVPVIGPGSASYHAAALLGHRFCVVTVDDSMIESCYELGYKCGCLERLAAVVGVNIPVLELADDRERSLNRMVEACEKVIAEKRIDTLVLGCMSMGFLDVAEELQERLGIPCVNPAKNVLKFTEAVVGQGLAHSKKAYALPPKLRDGKVKGLSELYLYR